MRFVLVLLAVLFAVASAIPNPRDTNTTTSIGTSDSRVKPKPFTIPSSEVAFYLANPANLTALSARAGDPLVCIHTTSAPSLAAIHGAANYLISHTSPSTLCKQDKKTDKYACSWKVWHDEANLFICGPYMKNVRCHTLAWAAKHIANNCDGAHEKGYAAGIYVFENAGVWAHVE